ncbi:TIM barrel protein [Akkermansiaceae bacterium]|nr:TIM barrel protein [Akkermansiaceae bacterium]MDB4724990.1 TIM barrel protein [Akkermansiaceae bacterium]
MAFSHSVCRWCFGETPLLQLADWCCELGIHGIDLLTPEEANEIKGHGLVCPVSTFPQDENGLGCIEKAFNKVEHHAPLLKLYQKWIPAAAEAGIPNIIVFSGNRDGLDDTSGLNNCARGLEPIIELAEKHEVRLVMELLNSKVDHPDYECDFSKWGIELRKKLASSRFGLLYDIYHMQVMEGDVIATIKQHHEHFFHYHTAGVPGRNELDESQELYYPAIIKAIRDTGYEGFVAQEFVPTWDDHKAALTDAIKRCS